MEQALSEAGPIFKANPIFHGFAIHDYVGYVRLSRPAPNPTPSPSASPELVATSTPASIPVTVTSETVGLCDQVSIGTRSPDVVIHQVAFVLNGGTPQAVNNEGVITVRPGDNLSLADLWYCSDVDAISRDAVAVEVYVRKNGSFDYSDGRFGNGVQVLAGKHPLGGISGRWTVRSGWDRLVIALVHYYPGGNEVDDRFFVNLAIQ